MGVIGLRVGKFFHLFNMTKIIVVAFSLFFFLMHECRLCSDFFMGIKIPLKFAFLLTCGFLALFSSSVQMLSGRHGFQCCKSLKFSGFFVALFFCEENIFSFLSSTGQNILVIYFI